VGWLGSGGSYANSRSYIRREEVVLRERHEEGDKLVRVILNARETLTGDGERNDKVDPSSFSLRVEGHAACARGGGSEGRSPGGTPAFSFYKRTTA
jgi:hypothetical protein